MILIMSDMTEKVIVSVLYKTIDVKTEAKTEAAGFETEVETMAEAVYL